MSDETKGDAMTTPSPGRAKHKRRMPEPKRMSDAHINVMDSIFPGFAAWYRANYDVQGRCIAEPIPGLRPVEERQS